VCVQTSLQLWVWGERIGYAPGQNLSWSSFSEKSKVPHRSMSSPKLRPPSPPEKDDEEKLPIDPTLSEGRRPALYQPSLAELEATNKRNVVIEGDYNERLMVCGFRVNPMRKKQGEGSWGASEQEASIMGCAGPSYIGKVFRNPVSAEIGLSHHSQNLFDFHAVDLWTRANIDAPLQKLKKDKYLFRAYPMQYRTWLYHEIHRTARHPETADETATLRKVLSKVCIDAPVGAARWSPFMLLVPGLFFVAMMQDEQLSVIAIFFAITVQQVSISYNSVEGYKYIRFMLLLPRVLWIVFVVIRAGFWLGEANPAQVTGFLGTLLFAFLDFWFGDKEVINNYKLNCRYDFLKHLPNRVFIVRRKGAADTEFRFGFRGVVHQNIAGSGKWGTDMLLVAEIMGCIFELRPFNHQDWEQVKDMYAIDENFRLCFWGLDCYNKDTPTYSVLERNRMVNEAAAASKAGQRSDDSKVQVDPDILLKQLQETQALLKAGPAIEDNASDNMADSPPPTPDDSPKASKSKPPLLS